jgi:hypothetical protein
MTLFLTLYRIIKSPAQRTPKTQYSKRYQAAMLGKITMTTNLCQISNTSLLERVEKAKKNYLVISLGKASPASLTHYLNQDLKMGNQLCQEAPIAAAAAQKVVLKLTRQQKILH